MKVGGYTVELLRLGKFGMDGGGLFGIIPKLLWARAYPHVDDDNRVELVMWSLLIQGDGRVIVCDAGIGDKLDPKRAKHSALQQESRSLERQLEARGIALEDVTDFVYTHLHFDHAGGATRWGSPLGRDGGGADSSAVPIFPRARHYVQSRQLSWARNPSDKDRASFLPENWEPVVDAGLMNEVEGNLQLAPGIELRPVDGHTPGMQMIVIQGNSDDGDDPSGFVFTVDLFPTAAHLPVHYVAAFDNHPLLVLDEKRRLLEAAADNNWLIAFGHDAYNPMARVLRGARGYELEQVELRPDSA